jgi:hypothetical protein
MTSVPQQENDSEVRNPTQKAWRRPELRKLPIEATAASPSKTGSANADVLGGPKTADATGQFS